MPRYKRYLIIGASRYEVTHDERVFNKLTGKELKVRKDYRYGITNNFGKKILISAKAEYNKSKYEDTKTTTKIRKVKNMETNKFEKGTYDVINYFELGDNYPNYIIDRGANIFHKTRLDAPLADHDGWVYPYTKDGRKVSVNRFKLFASTVLKQKGKGPVHVEKFFFMFIDRYRTNMRATRNEIFMNDLYQKGLAEPQANHVIGTYCGNDPLSKKRIKIIPREVEYFRVRLLEFYPFYVFVYENENNFYIIHIDTGKKVVTEGIGYNLVFHLPVPRQFYSKEDGKMYSTADFRKVPLNKLHCNPQPGSFQKV